MRRHHRSGRRDSDRLLASSSERPALVASAATPQTAQANAALRYLYSQVGTDGSVAPAFGPGATEDTVISVADNGYDPATLKSPSTGTDDVPLPGRAGVDDHHRRRGGQVRARLDGRRQAGSDRRRPRCWPSSTRRRPRAATSQPNGAFHNAIASSETANAYSQSLAVLADFAAGVALPAHATGWLTCAQRTDGGFGLRHRRRRRHPAGSCGDTASDTNDGDHPAGSRPRPGSPRRQRGQDIPPLRAAERRRLRVQRRQRPATLTATAGHPGAGGHR